jgi:hypothetical protein
LLTLRKTSGGRVVVSWCAGYNSSNLNWLAMREPGAVVVTDDSDFIVSSEHTLRGRLGSDRLVLIQTLADEGFPARWSGNIDLRSAKNPFVVEHNVVVDLQAQHNLRFRHATRLDRARRDSGAL